MKILMAGATHKGRSRRTNQDSIFYDQLMGVGIVADGIGGRSGGEIASSMAVSQLKQIIQSTKIIRHEEIKPFLINAIDKANLAIIARGEHEPEISGMGTTLNCLLFTNENIYIAHIGDSRTYLYYEGNLWQVTLDHSVQVFLERGWLKSANLTGDWKGGALVRALGLNAQCEVDVYHKSIRPGEIFITASDGLFDMLKDHEIVHLLRHNADDLHELPKILIDAANRKGGKDNITVLISKVEEGP